MVRRTRRATAQMRRRIPGVFGLKGRTEMRYPGWVKMSQRTKILEWLKAGNTITSIEAFEKWGCTRLSARINEINQEPGIFVDKIMTEGVNRDGEKIRYARYYLWK